MYIKYIFSQCASYMMGGSLCARVFLNRLANRQIYKWWQWIYCRIILHVHLPWQDHEARNVQCPIWQVVLVCVCVSGLKPLGLWALPHISGGNPLHRYCTCAAYLFFTLTYLTFQIKATKYFLSKCSSCMMFLRASVPVVVWWHISDGNLLQRYCICAP